MQKNIFIVKNKKQRIILKLLAGIATWFNYLGDTNLSLGKIHIKFMFETFPKLWYLWGISVGKV